MRKAQLTVSDKCNLKNVFFRQDIKPHFFTTNVFLYVHCLATVWAQCTFVGESANGMHLWIKNGLCYPEKLSSGIMFVYIHCKFALIFALFFRALSYNLIKEKGDWLLDSSLTVAYLTWGTIYMCDTEWVLWRVRDQLVVEGDKM